MRTLIALMFVAVTVQAQTGLSVKDYPVTSDKVLSTVFRSDSIVTGISSTNPGPLFIIVSNESTADTVYVAREADTTSGRWFHITPSQGSIGFYGNGQYYRRKSSGSSTRSQFIIVK